MMDKSAQININKVTCICRSSSEAQEVMLETVLVNQYNAEDEVNDEDD